MFYTGVVENRQDPLKLGRCQVRVVGLHTQDKLKIKTEDLPWAYPMQPVTSAAISGIGISPVGPVEGTWVVVIFKDEDQQIPIMIGTIGGIPQDSSVADGIIIKNDAGVAPVFAQEVVTTNDGTTEVIADPNPITEQTPPSSSNDSPIPTVPPPSFKGDKAKATAGIKALLAACDKVGLTTKEQKCSVLALAGGECNWIPVEEGYSYSAEALQSTFASTFKGKPELASKYARWQGTREEFFAFVYAPENNGRQLGNTQTGDGGKFYGRGFNQITGRANYTKYAKLSGVDILTNPSILNTDLNQSAVVTATMIKDKTSKSVSPSANPDWFLAAKKGNGNDTGNGAAVRQAYYEYFYGQSIGSTNTNEKIAGSAVGPSTSDTGANPSYDQGPIGFKDPNNKYPLKPLINEPDTNRLARGIKRGTNVEVKETNRVLDIRKGLSDETYDEPPSTYAARYPFNHVLETESGHVQEWDDTPGHERLSIYHRKGTFTEIDPNGTEIHHVIGDKYTIVDRNGCIYITGEANLTVDGNINILCQSNANIEVTGDTNMQVGGDYNLGVAGNMNVAVGGKFTMVTQGNNTIQSNKETHIISGTNHYQLSGISTNIKAAGNINMDGSNIFQNSGRAHSALSASLLPPDAGVPLNKAVPYTIPPLAEGENVYQFESEEDWNTPAGKKAKAEMEKKYGVQNADNTPASDSAQPTGGSNKNTVASCKVIYATESFPDSFKLSKNFSFGMLYDHSGNHKLVDQNGLTKQQIICNLSQLCENILEPLLDVLPGGIGGYSKQWTINSGYRMLSNGVGSSSSDHPTGRAIDLSLLPKDQTRNKRHFEFIQQIEKILPYDQIILEYRSGNQCWMHIGYRGVKAGDTAGPGGINRKMAFTMLNDSTYKKDGKSGFYLL